MAIMVNEIWDRENREDHGPPTVVVETNGMSQLSLSLQAHSVELSKHHNEWHYDMEQTKCVCQLCVS